jgi:hypothetical protein
MQASRDNQGACGGGDLGRPDPRCRHRGRRCVLKRLDNDIWKSRISEPKPAKGVLRWHGDEAAQKAVYANRARLKSAVSRRAMRKRGEMVERSFAHILDRGGMRRA